MRLAPLPARTRHHLVAALILLAGLAAATVIYLRAGSSPDELLEFSPDTSKTYLRDLQLYGGTANVLAVKLQTWFDGLWHGRSLAYTVGVLAAGVSAAYLFFAVVFAPHWRAAGPGATDSKAEAGRGPPEQRRQ
jgi:hypothetical protein